MEIPTKNNIITIAEFSKKERHKICKPYLGEMTYLIPFFLYGKLFSLLIRLAIHISHDTNRPTAECIGNLSATLNR